MLRAARAKRKLRKISGMEARFKRYTNHIISKGLVAVAEGTMRALALEDLKGIHCARSVDESIR
jgi:putative transposase